MYIYMYIYIYVYIYVYIYICIYIYIFEASIWVTQGVLQQLPKKASFIMGYHQEKKWFSWFDFTKTGTQYSLLLHKIQLD